MTGRLIAVVGPSGAGKDTLLAEALSRRPDLVLARRVITRPESAGGEPHEEATEEEFIRRREAGELVFWWEAHGLFYGVPATVLDQVRDGRTVIYNGSRKALPGNREAYPDLEIVVVNAPDAVLASRLAARGRETEADIRARLARASEPAPDGARIVMNDGTVEQGAERLLAALSPEAAGA